MIKVGTAKPYGNKIGVSEPVRCQKCGKPVGYITILSEGLLGMQQQIENVKIVAICMDCAQKM
jgi:hypothetical protein